MTDFTKTVTVNSFRAVAALLRTMVGCVVVWLASGCGDGDHLSTASPAKPTAPNPTAGYSVTGYLVKPSERIPVKFGPASARSLDPSTLGEQASQGALPSLRLQAIDKCPAGSGGCTSLDTKFVDDKLRTFDGEMLLMAVTDSCIGEQRA